jgi:hypothetical protein
VAALELSCWLTQIEVEVLETRWRDEVEEVSDIGVDPEG